MIKSTTRAGYPARVFCYTDEDERQMQVQFARLSVLYDDLMREYGGASEEGPIAPLDGTGINARRFYFVRRTLGTLSELRGSVAVLNKNKTFEGRRSAPGMRQLASADRSWPLQRSESLGFFTFLSRWDRLLIRGLGAASRGAVASRGRAV